jgi:DNA-binding transcriptional ArsR family regulator
MRPTHTIESILGTRSRLAVLRVLRGVRVPLNASQIAARTGLTRPAVASVLDHLGDMGIVRSSSAGRANVHLLERDNVYVTRLIEPLFQAEESIPDAMLDDLRSAFEDSAESVVLFGSYGRGDQQDTSDVDLVLVAGDREGKETLERAVDEYGPGFRARFGATLSPLVYEAREAASLWRTAPGLAESLGRDAVVVAGTAPRDWTEDG